MTTIPPLRLNNFSAGLHTEVDAASIPDGAASAMQNLLTDRGSLRVRPGMVLHDTLTAAHPKGLAEFYREDATDGVGDYLLAVTDTKVYESDSAQLFASPTDTALVVTTGAVARFAQGGATMYMTDGILPAQTWDGTTRKSLTQVVKPTQDIVVTVNKANTDIVNYNSAPSGSLGTNLELGCWGEYDFAGHASEDYWHVSGMRDMWDYFIARPAADEFLTTLPTNYIGAYMRTLTTLADPASVVRPLLALEVITDASTPTDYSETAKWFAKIIRLQANHLELPAVATTITIKYKVLCGSGGAAALPGVEFQIGEADLPWAGGTADPDPATNDLAYKVDITPAAADTWYTVDWDISTLIPTLADRDEILAIALKVDTTNVETTARLEVGVSDLVWYETGNEKTQCIYVVIDSITANMVPTSFVLGQVYEFCYTYVYADGEESAPSDITLVPPATALADLPVALTLGTTKDDGCTATKARIYGRGGVLGAIFILVSEVAY